MNFVRQSRKSRSLALLAGALAALGNASISRAVQHVVTAVAGAYDWATASSWSPAVVPDNTATDTYAVYVNNANFYIPLSEAGVLAPFTLDELHLGTNGEIDSPYAITVLNDFDCQGTMEGNVIVPGGTVLSGGSYHGEVQTISGNLTVEQGASLFGELAVAGQLSVNGTLELKYPATFSAPTLVNNGSIIVDKGSSLTLMGMTIDSQSDLGQITNNGTVLFEGAINNTGNTIRVGGSGDWQLGISVPSGQAPEPATLNGGTLASAPGVTAKLNQVVLNDVTLEGSFISSQIVLGAGNTLMGNATIQNSGITSQGGTFTIGPNITVDSADISTTTQPLVNQGTILASNVDLNFSSLDNEGDIEVEPNSSLKLNGPLTAAQFAQIKNNGGTIILGGVVDNTGNTLVINGGLQLGASYGGEIIGGTVQAEPGQQLVIGQGGTLDQVFLETNVSVPKGSSLVMSGTFNGENATINLSGGLTTSDSVLHIGSGVNLNVSGGGIVAYSSVMPMPPLINDGTIAVSGTSSFYVNGITNNGTIELAAGSRLYLYGSDLPQNMGNVVDDGGEVVVGGAIDLTGEVFALGPGEGIWYLANDLTGGTITTSGGTALMVDNSISQSIYLVPQAVLNDVTLNGVIRTVNSGGLIVGGEYGGDYILSGNGTVQLQSGGLYFDAYPDGPRGELDGVTVITTAAGQQNLNCFLTEFDNRSEIIVGTKESTLSMVVGNLMNFGRLEIDDGATMAVNSYTALGSNGNSNTAGTVVFEDGSVLAMELGPDASLFEVMGDLDLGGVDDSLELTLLPGGAVGVPVLIATYSGALSGEFANVTPGFTVDYSEPGEIFVTAVPEPGVVGVLVSLLAGAGRRGRRGKVASV